MKRISVVFAALWIAFPAHAAEFAERAGLVNALYAAVGGAVGIVLGAWGNHKLSISRDRRKEFNDICDPLRIALKEERQRVNNHYSSLDRHDVGTLVDIIGGKKGTELALAVAKYKDARGRWIVTDELGQPSYSQTNHIEEAIDNILPYLRRR